VNKYKYFTITIFRPLRYVMFACFVFVLILYSTTNLYMNPFKLILYLFNSMINFLYL